MKNFPKALALALAFGFGLHHAAAQDAAKKDAAPKPPVSASQALLDSWNDIGRKLTAMAEDFPEDKYDFKPNPAQRSFAEQLLHAAGANYFFINPVKGLKPPTGDAKSIGLQDQGGGGRVCEEVVRRWRGVDQEQGRQRVE